MWQLRQAVMLSAVFLPLASYAAYTQSPVFSSSER